MPSWVSTKACWGIISRPKGPECFSSSLPHARLAFRDSCVDGGVLQLEVVMRTCAALPAEQGTCVLRIGLVVVQSIFSSSPCHLHCVQGLC